MPKEHQFPYTHEEFLKLMVYDQDTGVLSWRNPKDGRVRNAKPKGYIKFKIKGIHYKAHRLIWFYHYGKWPESDVLDHIDRDIHNNRISNLREATFSENSRNCVRSWKSKIKLDDNVFQQGNKIVAKVQKTFATVEEAKAWRDKVTKLV